MKMLKKEVRRAICALLIAAMVCSDAGLAVYAAESKISEETVGEAAAPAGEAQAAEPTTGDSRLEEPATGDSQAGEPSTGDSESEEDLPENGETEGASSEDGEQKDTSSEKTPKEEETEGDSGKEDGESGAGTETEKPAEGDAAPGENTDTEDTENPGDASAGESVSENDVVDVEENLETAVKAAGDNIASGEYKENGNDITWVIDADGKLTVEGTGDFSDNYYNGRASWYDYRESIKYAKVDVIGMTDASYMFSNCEKLEEVDISNLDTSNVTNMRGMFFACYSLTSLNLVSFNTSNVTDMGEMFWLCSDLASLDLGSFDTGSVTDMHWMFEQCASLTSLNLSNFNTSNVTKMQKMFRNCRGLTSLDLSNFNTDNVTDMSGMFAGCRITSLDLSSFHTSNVVDMSEMFNGCGNITSLDLSNFNTDNVTDMSRMFVGCSSIISLDLSNFNTGKVTDMRYMFSDCSNLTGLDVSGFACNLIEMAGMFNKCENLTSLDMGKFDISKVEDVSDLFTGCTNLTIIHTPLNLTQSVALPKSATDIWYRFDGTEITELPQNLNCSIVVGKNEVPVLKSAITVEKEKTTYVCGDTINIDDLVVIYYDADGKATKITNGYSTNASEIDMSISGRKTLMVIYNNMTATVELTVKKEISGNIGDSGRWVLDTDGKLIVETTSDFYWSGNSAPWLDYKNDILSAEINITGVTNMSYMFYECKFLKSVNIKKFDTSKVTDMSSMFSGCKNLTSLDVSGFDTSKVTDMSLMFSGCKNLTSLDASGFDTSQVTNMSQMFEGCSNLTSLDVGSFNIDNVTSISRMFEGCSSLTSLDLSSFNKNQVTDTYAMFEGCISLKNLDMSSFDAGKVTNMNYMFKGCSSLTSVDLSSFNASKVINMEDMFQGCSSLKEVDLSSFDGSNLAGTYLNVFPQCDALRTIRTPCNLQVFVYLPREMTDTWYQQDGTPISILPQNLGHSIIIRRNEVPFISALKIVKIKTSYICGDTLNLDDLTVTYYDADATAHKIGSSEYTTNADKIDMSVAGKKTLIISYRDNGSIYTDKIELTVTRKMPENVIASGEYKENGNYIIWFIDMDGKLTVEGTGEFTSSTNYTRAPWYEHRDKVKSAEVNVTGMKDASYMFYGCYNLSEIDLSGFNAGEVTLASQMLWGSNKLQAIHTPRNLKVSIALQTGWDNANTWQQEDGTLLTELPQNLDHSILVTKNAGFRVYKTKTDYLRGETLNLDDLTVTYYGVDGTVRTIESGDYTTNVNEIDMSVKGKKTLIVTFNDGSITLTGEIELSVLNADDVIASGEYKENGNDITWVIYADGRLIVEGTGDFADNSGYGRAPWYREARYIKSAEIKVTGMTNASNMLSGCYNLVSVDLSQFDTGRVTDMSGMFIDCENLTSVDLSRFDTNNVTNMSNMFRGCSKLTSLDVSSFDTSNVTDMSGMFSLSYFWEQSNGSRLTSLDLSSFDTSNVTIMYDMFSGCTGMKALNISGFNTSKVIDMSAMFLGCSSMEDLDVSGFNTSNVTDMSCMFYGCISLNNLNVSSFDTSQVWSMSGMFHYCTSLTSLDLHNFDTSGVYDIHDMFHGCNSLASLDLSSFDLGNLEECWEEYSIFPDDKLQTMYTPYNLKISIPLGGTWYQEDGTELTELPKNLDHSIFIRRNPELLVSQIKATKAKTSYIYGDKVGLGDLTVIYYNAAGVARRLRRGEYTTNVGDINTSGEGKRTLTITYRDGGDVFTDNIELTVAKLAIGADNITITVADAVYDGTPRTPGVTVSCMVRGDSLDDGSVSGNSLSRESVSDNSVSGNSIVLEKDKDYTVSYENNINAFEDSAALATAQDAPRVVITGQTQCSGTVSKGFIIQKAAAPQAEECLETRDYNVGQSGCTLDLSGCFAEYQKTGYTVGKPVEDDTVAGSVISGQPAVDEKGILSYGTVAGKKGDFAVIPVTVSFRNHKDGTINVKIMLGDGRMEDIAIPTASPESGRQLVEGSKVTLTCGTAGAEIYYTTGASVKELADPAEKGTRYTEPLTINNDMYIRAVAMKGENRSKTVTFHYTVLTVADQVMKPYAVPGQGVVGKGTKIELKSDMPDAVIYYVTGKNADVLGAVPADDSCKYTAPIEITEDMVIKAVARKEGMKDSDAAVFVYRVNVAINTPVADPATGTEVEQGSYISLTADSDADIYYTTDQSDPAVSGTAKLYERRIRVDGDAGSVIVIRAAAVKKGIYSETVTFTYTVSGNKVKGLHVMLAGSDEFIYTGSAITPAVIVTNNGVELTEGEDYTIRYSNNVKAADKDAARAPRITVTGKGNLTKSRSITFSITPMYIGDEEEVVGGSIVAVRGKTAAPVLFYGGVKLTAKDFVNPSARKKYDTDETITITGKGNFEGTRDIDVRVVNKEDMKKFAVVIDNTALKNEPLVYDGEEKTMDGYFEVFDTQDKSSPLEEYSDYAVIYPKNNINAGKVKFTVVGLGEYFGTVTKTYTIKPRVVKTAEDGDMQVNVEDGDSYSFKNGGVTISDLLVTCDGDTLVPGKDYKVTYSGNKKICTDNKAKCTISFKGNYKGSKSLVRKFHITPAVLDDVDQINGSVSVAAGDMVYTGKRGAYKSVPYVTVNGALLKSSDYKVSYYKDPDRKQVIDGKTAESSVELVGQDSQTVYVKIEGKGNYEGVLTAEYNVYKLTEGVIDLARAKITIVGGNKQVYTGEGVMPDIEILYKSGTEWKKVDPNDIGTYVKVSYISNVNKGKATVMVNGTGSRYAGSKTAGFSIVSKSME